MLQSTQPQYQTNAAAITLNGTEPTPAGAFDIQLVPLTKLVVSKLNVRKHGERDVTSLARSIAEQGLLQPLVVRAFDDKFEVICGGRRTLAIRKLKAKGATEFDVVPCVITTVDDAAAIAASLAENIERLPMDELDQYDAFAALVKAGQSDEDIARHFGVTLQVVRQRLALANLLPDVKALYRADDIGAKELQLLTLAPKAKQRTYVQLDEDERPHQWELKAWLFGGVEIATSAALFAEDDYKGPLTADLFGDEKYFGDSEAFWALQNAAIAKLRSDLEAEGWPVEVVGPDASFERWRYETTSQAAGGKAYIVVSANGCVDTWTDLLGHTEAARLHKAAVKGALVDAGTDTRPEMSRPLADYVDLVRHGAVRQALAVAPNAALRVAVLNLLCGARHWRVEEPKMQSVGSTVVAELEGLPATQSFHRARAEAARMLGFETWQEAANERAAVWARLTTMPDGDVMLVLAAAVAGTLGVGTTMVDGLGAQLGVDVRTGWTPSDVMFGLTRDKDALRGMVAEVAGDDVALMHVTSTAAKLRTVLRNAAEGRSDWLPCWFAFPQRGYTSRRLSNTPVWAA